MATPAQCAFCFECLSANLEKREPLSLDQVNDLWEAWVEDGEGDGDIQDATLDEIATSIKPSKKSAISRLLGSSPTSSSSTSLQSASSSIPDRSEASSRSSLSTSREPGAKCRKTSSDEKYPLFVTWNTITRNGEKRLRGCIGTFEAQRLEHGLGSYALTSALEDTRFHPIVLRELPTLDCGITLLTNFETVPDPLDWDLGKHGIRISFASNGRRYGATYLPDVASEQGWTKEETLASLMRKAGYSGKKDDWKSMPSFQVVRYQGKKESLDYATFKEWREWAARR